MTSNMDGESPGSTLVVIALAIYTAMVFLAGIGLVLGLQALVRASDAKRIALIMERNRKPWKDKPNEMDDQVIFKDAESKHCHRRQDGKPLGDVYVTSSGERWHADKACVGLGDYRRFCRTPCQLCARDV